MASNQSNVTDNPPTSDTTIDWSSEFQSPAFLTGLRTALAGLVSPGVNLESHSTQLEHLGDALPSPPSTSTPATGISTVAQGMFTAPSFVTALTSSSVQGASSLTQIPSSEFVSPTAVPSVNSQFPNHPIPVQLGPEKAFSLGPGRAPIPAKLVSKILSHQYFELSELLPENLDEPISDTTSFAIEGSTIIPVSKSARPKKQNLDILSWVECFNSYVSVIATFQPHRARDLLAYMALIIRTAKRFGGRAWFNYDRAFRREAEVNNLQDWSIMRTDLYNFYTSALNCVPDALLFNSRHPNADFQNVTPRTEPSGSLNNTQLCISWNQRSCVSPRARCRFRHACNITGCGKSHRRIEHNASERREKRRISLERGGSCSRSRSQRQ